MNVPKKVERIFVKLICEVNLWILTNFFTLFQGNKSGDVLRQTYFLGTRTQNQKIGQRNKAGLWLKKLKCEICQRTFHYE